MGFAGGGAKLTALFGGHSLGFESLRSEGLREDSFGRGLVAAVSLPGSKRGRSLQRQHLRPKTPKPYT